MIPPLPHPPSHTKKSRVDKVSVTLRIPTELKEWADAFARDADLDISGLFIQSLRETQRR